MGIIVRATTAPGIEEVAHEEGSGLLTRAGCRPAAVSDAESFRVSCSRVGAHGFRSPEVERETGSILQARYGTAVDLEGYTLHVKVDIVGTRAFSGY